MAAHQAVNWFPYQAAIQIGIGGFLTEMAWGKKMKKAKPSSIVNVR